MWISSVTVDINVLAQNSESFGDALALINEKKSQLREIDGDGRCIPGFEDPDASNIPSDVENLIIKRTWNTESAAAEYASFVQNLNVGLIVSIEEQV